MNLRKKKLRKLAEQQQQQDEEEQQEIAESLLPGKKRRFLQHIKYNKKNETTRNFKIGRGTTRNSGISFTWKETSIFTTHQV